MGEGDSVTLNKNTVKIEGDRNLYNYTFTVHDDPSRDLLHVIESGDAHRVSQFLDAHPHLQMETAGSAHTPLHVAARLGNPEILRTLIQRGAGLETEDAERAGTALAWAAFYGHPAAVEELLRSGARVNTLSLDNARAGAEGRLSDVSEASADDYKAVLALLEKGETPQT